MLSVIIPALNEEKNILFLIDDIMSAFKQFEINGEIIVINDGSIDSTPLLVKRKIEENPGIIKMISHEIPKGIGASFWDGVDTSRGNAICMLPGDNENDPREILRYFNLLEDVDVVIPFVFNRGTRSLLRNTLSFIFKVLINTTFLISIHYTNGTVLYRKSLLNELNYQCQGFFFQVDILIRLLKKGYLFAEVPYKLRKRKGGKSKALTLHSLREVLKGYLKLFRDIYFKKDKAVKLFSADSVTNIRYRELV